MEAKLRSLMQRLGNCCLLAVVELNPLIFIKTTLVQRTTLQE